MNFFVFLTSLFWPIDLALNNNTSNFIGYAACSLLTAISLLLVSKHPKLSAAVLLPIPFLTPKLSIFLIIIFSLQLALKRKKIYFFFIILSLIILLTNWPELKGETIFNLDYEKKQEVIRNTRLYNSIPMARLFHNKPRIVIDKFNIRFFFLIDPSNYFFKFHPREGLINNQNLQKFPSLALIPFLIALINISSKNKSTLVYIFSAIIALSLLNNFDRHDFILFFPMLLLIKKGFEIIFKTKYKLLYAAVFLIFTVFELTRILII